MADKSKEVLREDQIVVSPGEIREALEKPVGDVEAQIARTRKKVQEMNEPLGLDLEAVRSGDVIEANLIVVAERDDVEEIRNIPVQIEVLKAVTEMLYEAKLIPKDADSYKRTNDKKLIEDLAALTGLRFDALDSQLIDLDSNKIFRVELRKTVSRKEPEKPKPDNSIDISDLLEEEEV